MKYLLAAVLAVSLVASAAMAGEKKPVRPKADDKCPVCGMFVAKYPDFLAQIIFKDGSYALFDGTKDMAKYYFNLAKYNPSKKVSDIDSIYVTDYYQLELTDGMSALYVVGSDVYGPMGKELIPIAKKDDAEEFMLDHGGDSLLQWKEITPDILKPLD
jgi:nitrous oxide reductase accessory protein NosL